MYHFFCDRCGKGLLVGEDVRYEATLEIKSAYDPLEITNEDLQHDFRSNIERLLKQMENRSEQELEDEVYKLFKFDLCHQCQKEILKNPMFLKIESQKEYAK